MGYRCLALLDDPDPPNLNPAPFARSDRAVGRQAGSSQRTATPRDQVGSGIICAHSHASARAGRLRYTLRPRALIEVVPRPHERTVRIARWDRAETDDLGRPAIQVEKSPDVTLPIPHLAEINSLYRCIEICRISYWNFGNAILLIIDCPRNRLS